MVQVIFWGLVVAAFVLLYLALNGKPRWYWWAALTWWVVSFLGSFSIGLYTLVVAVICLVLAAGHSLGWIRQWWQAGLAVAAGVGIWVALVSRIDDFWLFFPINRILNLLFG